MASPTHERKTYPAVGEVFELTMSAEITGLGMVQAFGYTPRNWRFTGKTVPAGTTRRFMLVQVGYQENLAAVATACGKKGTVPEGVWMLALDQTFRQDGAGPVGVADPSWEDPSGDAHFPMVYSGGARYFYWAVDRRLERWRWLVAV